MKISNDIIKCLLGLFYYKREMRPYLIDENCRAFVVGSTNDELAFLKKYVRLFRIRYGIRKTILYIEEDSKQEVNLTKDGIDNVIKISKKDLERIKRLYELYEFDDRVIFCDRTGISGRIVPVDVSNERYVSSILLDLNHKDIELGKEYLE